MSKSGDLKIADDFVQMAVSFYSITRQPSQSCPNKELIRGNSRAFQALFTLKYHPKKSFTMSELADELLMSKQQLTKLVNTLEEQQLVRRVHDAKNRRRVLISLLPAGSEMVESTQSQMAHHLVDVLNRYSVEEKQQLSTCIDTFRKLFSRMSSQ